LSRVLASLIPDERLELVFTCCHPALALDAHVTLTLRTLGLTTEEIARAFLVPRLELVQSDTERHFLERRLAEL
jgi:RNA polymerase sigma-70 factor, ECF subfamily